MNAASLPCVLDPAARRPHEQLHLSIDIETLGVRMDSAIIQIAFVAFYPERAEIVMAHQSTVTREGQDRHVSEETVKWHDERGGAPDLREANQDSLVDLAAALQVLVDMIQPGDVIWAKSPTFDCMILRHAFDQLGFKSTPWHFRHERDIRTAEELIKIIGGKLPEFVGTPHIALDDALHQARIVIAAFYQLGDLVAGKWGAIELHDLDESASPAADIAQSIIERAPDMAIAKPSNGQPTMTVLVVRSVFRPIFIRSMVDKSLRHFGIGVDSVEIFKGGPA